ncbi:MAG: UDP-glucose--hexose-1-phosphate uridylyltransferase [Lachnospiraceae bacterium]|nr:UDP-glucose--hexose-1-phosphate uridylyltransferase [Lachnospiraceae bacterium]
MNISTLIKELVDYGIKKGLVEEADKCYTINRLLELFNTNEYAPETDSCNEPRELHLILEDMLDYAVKEGLTEDTITCRDLFDTKITGLLTPPPSEIRRKFAEAYGRSSKEATDFYYDFSKATNYIRTDRIKKDEKWVTDTEFGKLDITINLSKPEKDPRDIAKAGAAKKSGYPACLLCRENEGYAGHISHPARQNHRIIPITLCDEDYYLQYSPYVYYNEHCIILNAEHTPMKIDRNVFSKLLDFIRQFPHYIVGSNADLPIVGGSILSHDHFQGGSYEFPMARAEYASEFELKQWPDVHAGRIKWPLSTIRLQSKNIGSMVDAADHILASWRAYTDEEAYIYAYTDGTPHNTITPIARRNGDLYELDLVLRNNITTGECPMGLYHPHSQYHHIKKENIGLIEVMGLAILPARLKKEMAILKEDLLNGTDISNDERITSHAEWAKEWSSSLDLKDEAVRKDLDNILHREIGLVFANVLRDAGVYKCNEEGDKAFDRFITSL